MSQSKVFAEVINSNLEFLSNRVKNECNDLWVTKLKNKQMTEDQIKKASIAFFYSELAKHLTDYLKP